MIKSDEILNAVDRKSVKDQVFEQLRDKIILGVWEPGSKIPSENDLRRQFGVSRISVREAIHKLAALEIVETRQGEGTFVKKITSSTYMNMLIPVLVLGKKDLIEVLEYRKIMEVGTVEMAVEKATADDLEKLEHIVRRMESEELDEKEFALDDLEFHMTIAKSTKNELIFRVNNIIRDILNVSMKDIVHNLGRRDGRYYHRKILEAMKERNKEKAVSLMREHVVLTIERIKASRYS